MQKRENLLKGHPDGLDKHIIVLDTSDMSIEDVNAITEEYKVTHPVGGRFKDCREQAQRDSYLFLFSSDLVGDSEYWVNGPDYYFYVKEAMSYVDP